MDKYERRRLRLLRVRDEQFEGSNAALAKRLGKAPDYLTRMLYEADKAGRKRIGEDSVEAIKLELGIDLDGDAAPAAPSTSRKLQYVDDWEAELLSHCRATNDQGRDTIMTSAELVPHVLLDELAAHQAKKDRR